MITTMDIYKEIKSPDEVSKMQEPPMLGLIYKAIYMCLRLLIDIRANQVRMSHGAPIVKSVEGGYRPGAKSDKQLTPPKGGTGQSKFVNPVIKADINLKVDN